jgi:DNA-3-methyladenine glycosylase
VTPDIAQAAVDTGRGPPPRPLDRAFFERPVEVLAEALLGTRLVRRWADGALSWGRIVEVEAYGGPEDRASHARSGPTRRNATMFGRAGHAYVYRIYGLHSCLNVVGEQPGEVGAVLIRAVMPEGGVPTLRSRRDRPGRTPLALARLAAGPGNVGAAFSIDAALDGTDLTQPGPLWLEPADVAMAARPGRSPASGLDVVRGPRIGVAYAGPGWADRPRRFGLRGHPALSRPFPQVA